MTPWSYSDYRKSVEHDINQGIERLGFSVDASIGYAGNELLLRLYEFPAENVMALTALAIAAHQRGVLSTYTKEDEFYEELVQAYADGEHIAIVETLDSLQKREFLRDIEIVSGVLGIDVELPSGD